MCEGGICRTCRNGAIRRTPGRAGGTCGYKDRGTWYDVCRNYSWQSQAQCRDVWYASCKEYLQAHPNAKGGRKYTLDPDGPNQPSPSRKYYCTANGWTRVDGDTFDNGKAPGWSKQVVTTCGAYTNILGGNEELGGESVSKRYAFPPVPHTRVRVALQFIAIDDWEASGLFDDLAYLDLEGNRVDTARFSGDNGRQQCGASDRKESRKTLVGDVKRSAHDVGVSVGADTSGGKSGESWGFDNVSVWVK